jgi:hypothetical protein
LDAFEHFQEIRFQIDQHLAELKKRIDGIALALIDQTKKSEEKYLRDLKENFSSFDETQSVEDKLNEVEETFRNPNILIQSIKEMKQKQEESLKDIQLKLDEMNQVKDDLKASNQFKPNLIPFNQNKTSCFGLIKLNGYWLNTNSLKSEILKGEQQYLELIKLCEFSPNDKWSLLYRGTRDGFGTNHFHSKCDGHSNTLTIFKVKQSSFIFGGFTSFSWESSTKSKWKSNWIFFKLFLFDIEFFHFFK